MLRIAVAEIRYSVLTLVAWLAVPLVVAAVQLLKDPTLAALPDTLPLSIALLLIYVPLAAAVTNFRLLIVEQNEKHLRLFSVLPVSRTQLAVSRMLRMLATPVLALAISGLLVLIGMALDGPAFFASVGSWAVLAALLGGFVLLTTQLLLFDLGGLQLIQLIGVGLALLFVTSGKVINEVVLLPLFELAETPLGVLLLLVLGVALAAADIAVFRRRASL